LGLSGLPICMAKTHLSLSHDPKLLGAPAGLRCRCATSALRRARGSLYPLCGDMRTMPGLPAHPAYENVDVVDGKIVGLF
jgi:Formate-tetrahydrofolate ligase (EC 6.3.4.3)